MTHREAILQAILDDPADDLHRLAYADCCEEEGHLARAEFIRLSLRYAQYLDASVSDREIGQIANRMHEIYVYACEQILADLRFDYAYTWNPVESFHDYDREHQQTIYLWRGWVREVAMPQELFLQHAESLFNAHPIERVRLTDRDPMARSQDLASYMWQTGVVNLRSYVAPQICQLLRSPRQRLLPHPHTHFYDTREEANADLESAALAYGRSLRKPRPR